MAIQAALKKIYASAPDGDMYYECLILEHPDGGTKYLTNHFAPLTKTWSGGSVEFVPHPFQIVLPKRDDGGQQDMRIGLSSLSRGVIDYLEDVFAGDTTTPITCSYTVYIDSTAAQQIDPALELQLTDIAVTERTVTAVATRADVLNRPFPSLVYDIATFPGLDRP